VLGSEVLPQVTGGTGAGISSTLGASCSSHERRHRSDQASRIGAASHREMYSRTHRSLVW